MKGIDTNVLLRILLQGDVRQSRLATDYVAKNCSAQRPCYINRAVLCELAWALKGLYRLDRALISSSLERMLSTIGFEIEDEAEVRRAVAAHRSGFDFADALIAAVNARAGCVKTATFDAQAADLPQFELIA